MNDTGLVENSGQNKTLIIVGSPGSKNQNIANQWKSQSAPGSQVVDVSGAKTVAEANKMIAAAAGDTKFDRAYFIGHGHSERGIKLGSAWVNPDSKDWGSFVGTIKGATTENAGVGFYACRLGRGDVLSTMAKDLGGNRWVGGFKNYLGISNRPNEQGYGFWTSNNRIGPGKVDVPAGAARSHGPWGGFNSVYNEPQPDLF